ncbi:hypothetical protein PEBR_32166 [Penicillium brasilianum]|uniref:Uncharacterized protein n=1 Tax=Penicillium brasilianum TaxID=104259 RepID=A0A1S9RFL1_PENBI|nr:hypothetical protein PEBR_32166 [Penicillium brasilianum]
MFEPQTSVEPRPMVVTFGTPVGHPSLASDMNFVNLYPFNDIETILLRPMLFNSGDQAHSREFSEDTYANTGEPKVLFWVDLYDRCQAFIANPGNMVQNKRIVIAQTPRPMYSPQLIYSEADLFHFIMTEIYPMNLSLSALIKRRQLR